MRKFMFDVLDCTENRIQSQPSFCQFNLTNLGGLRFGKEPSLKKDKWEVLFDELDCTDDTI